MDRASALSDPMAAVNICLVGKDGRGLLHRISPVNDPQETFHRMEEICKVTIEHYRAELTLLCHRYDHWLNIHVVSFLPLPLNE